MMTLYVGNGNSFAELKKDLTIFPQLLLNIRVKDKQRVLGDNMLKTLIAEETAKLGKEGRLLVRPSGTEPLIRIMTEARTMPICEEVCNRIKKRIEQIEI